MCASWIAPTLPRLARLVIARRRSQNSKRMCRRWISLCFFFCFRLWNRDATLMGLAGNLKYCLGYFTVPAAKSSVNAEILKLNHKRHTKIKQCPECETEKSYTPYYTKTWYVLRWTEESHARNQVLTFNLVITPILRFCRTWMLNLTCTNSVQILEPTVQR